MRYGFEQRRILHVITGLGVGGAEAILTRLVGELARRGIEQHVVCLGPAGHYAPAIRQVLGDRLICLDVRYAWHIPLATFRLARLIRVWQPEVVQGWLYHSDLLGLLALYLSGRRRTTDIYWGIRCSNLDLAQYSRHLRLVIWLCRLMSRLPDGILVNSQAGIETHTRWGFAGDRMTLVPNALDVEEFDAPTATRREVRASLGIEESAFVIAVVARTDPMKDYETFLQALDRMPFALGLGIGDGTKDLPQAPNFRGLGLRADVRNLLGAVDVLVSSSAFGEGFSNSILEAMAAGRPVVATDVGDARRIVDEPSVIVPPRDPAALAAAVKRLYDDPGLRRRLGKANRDRVQAHFSVSVMADRFLAAYEEGGTATVAQPRTAESTDVLPR